jgi:hypothetical protein
MRGKMGTDDRNRVLDKYGYVVSSGRRIKIVVALRISPMTPRQLVDETGIGISHISNVLSDLVNEAVIVCVNPQRVRGRVFELTSGGKKVADSIVLSTSDRRRSRGVK